MHISKKSTTQTFVVCNVEFSIFAQDNFCIGIALSHISSESVIIGNKLHHWANK